MHDEMQEPTEEELRAALEEQMRTVRVEEVIVQTVAILVNLAGRRLGLAGPEGEEASEERDLEQARTAIEGARALMPLCPADQIDAVRQALTQLQMAFARQAPGGAPAERAAGQPAPGPASPTAQQSAEEAERAKARSKIWTPPGA